MVKKGIWTALFATGTGRWILAAVLGLMAFLTGSLVVADYMSFDLRFLPLGAASVLAALGLIILIYSLARVVKRIFEYIYPYAPFSITRFLQIGFLRRRGPRIVVIGGGTGLSVLLKGLKNYTDNLTAVVTVTDDGGSSGRLRSELGVLPPGDIRNCLVALAETETLMDQVFQHRFQAGSLKGHNLGNLLLTALAEITGDFIKAIKEVSKVLAVRGEVLPATLEQVTLCARMKDGQVVMGESSITAARNFIEEISLIPADPRGLPEAASAIKEADAVILGPGSLYTSIIPNLLVKEIGDAVRQTRAVRILVINIMTQPGETDGYTASDHIRAVHRHIGSGHIQFALINNTPLDEERRRRYQSEGAEPVAYDVKEITELGVRPVVEALLGKEEVARHDQDKLARAIMRIVYRSKGLTWIE